MSGHISNPDYFCALFDVVTVPTATAVHCQLLKVGRPQLTWIKVIEKDLASVGIDIIDVYGEPPE